MAVGYRTAGGYRKPPTDPVIPSPALQIDGHRVFPEAEVRPAVL